MQRVDRSVNRVRGVEAGRDHWRRLQSQLFDTDDGERRLIMLHALTVFSASRQRRHKRLCSGNRPIDSDIVRVLERDPRSYILIESRLFKAANWEHFHWDEIDRLDDAAEKLFHELLEDL